MSFQNKHQLQQPAILKPMIFDSDEFYMYIFKVKKCPKMKSHDWTLCPFLHKGEKARRRDPRKFHYSAEICSEQRVGQCKRGDLCELAHGVFEYWLHPAKFRTRMCTAGLFCERKVCFFAHTKEQLRLQGMKHSCHCTCRLRLLEGSSSGGNERRSDSESGEAVDLDFVGRFRRLSVEDGDDDDDEFPDVDWVSELVN